MHHAIAKIFRMGQRRDHGKHPLLLRPAEMGLKSHNIINSTGTVVLPELHHRIGLLPGFGILEPHGLQRPIAQGILPPAGHDLHRHAALKDLFILKAMYRRLFGTGKLPDKALILLLVHGAVDIVRCPLVVAGGKPAVLHVQRLKAHQRRSRIIEIESLRTTKEFGNSLRHGIGSQRACGNDCRSRRDLRQLLMYDFNVLVAFQRTCDGSGKSHPIHRQCTAGFHPVFLGAFHNEASQMPEFFFQKSNGIGQ